jgi:hypothetical protein
LHSNVYDVTGNVQYHKWATVRYTDHMQLGSSKTCSQYIYSSSIYIYYIYIYTNDDVTVFRFHVIHARRTYINLILIRRRLCNEWYIIIDEPSPGYHSRRILNTVYIKQKMQRITVLYCTYICYIQNILNAYHVFIISIIWVGFLIFKHFLCRLNMWCMTWICMQFSIWYL